MPSNSSASMYGGAGGRGSMASVGSLAGLRTMLGKDTTERDSPRSAAVPSTSAAPDAPAAPPADDKQTLRGLNNRLSGYLQRVKQLHEENNNLEKEIDDILAKRKTPEGRDWDKVQEPLKKLKDKIKDITMDNARMLLQIDNTKMANNDFKDKLDDETKAWKVLEKDMENMKNVLEDLKINRAQMQKEIELAKDEISHLENEHKNEVRDLLERIKNSEVKVEIESNNSNLANIVNSIRIQYDNAAEKKLKETDDWYKTKFENIKVEEAQNVEAMQSGQSQIKDLLKQKKMLEVQIQTEERRAESLKENLMNTKAEYTKRMGPLNQVILRLERDLRDVRGQVEQQLEANKNLLCVKMKLEQEIEKYQSLIHGMTADTESLELALKDDVHSAPPAPEENHEAATEAAGLVMVKSAPCNQSTPTHTV